MTQNREETIWKALNAGPFMGAIGPFEAARDGEGGYVYALQTGADHANAIGLVHGGVICSLLDQALAMVAWTAADRAPTVTVQMDTRFVGAARPGARLEARAQLRQRTGSMMFLDAEVTEAGRAISLASSVMKISKRAET